MIQTWQKSFPHRESAFVIITQTNAYDTLYSFGIVLSCGTCLQCTNRTIYLSSVLIPQKKHRPFSLLRTGDVLWIYYVFLGAHFKNISRTESPVRWSSSFCNASTLTAICCGNLFNSSAILFKPAGQQ